jgi:hypothetical protein
VVVTDSTCTLVLMIQRFRVSEDFWGSEGARYSRRWKTAHGPRQVSQNLNFSCRESCFLNRLFLSLLRLQYHLTMRGKYPCCGC